MHFPNSFLEYGMSKILVLLITLALAAEVHAAITPLSVGVAPPVQFPPSDFTITGIRTSVLWGHHRDVYGLDLGGIGNITDQRFVGIGVAGGFNATYGYTTILGLQLAGVANLNHEKATVIGVQAAAGLNYNKAASSVFGFQLALANVAEFTDVYGAQVGLYNQAKDVYGLQIGVVNMADNLHGLQVGLINFNRKGLIGVAPLLNVGF